MGLRQKLGLKKKASAPAPPDLTPVVSIVTAGAVGVTLLVMAVPLLNTVVVTGGALVAAGMIKHSYDRNQVVEEWEWE